MELEIRNFLISILDVVFPIYCLGCNKEGEWLCDTCIRALPLKTPVCPLCKRESAAGEYCATCQTQSSLDGIAVAVDYHHVCIQQAIKTLKYHFVPALNEGLGKILVRCIQFNLEQSTGLARFFVNFNKVVFIPVPLHPRRLRWRGFNQAAILAQAVSGHFRLAYNDMDLRRIRYTKSQARLHARERLHNLADSFAWRGGDLSGRNILLIHDVATTGATLQECAKVLKTAGAGSIWGLVVARN